ncbi:elongation of very long chain fatty acids protein [Trypanosoma conorhini]|uniref:Elongation of fatty acids protein n=1 Tax=Trypanosoma conorhini TaxID=83891 RepID=A0A422Q9V9_9TRYP|nr:elongation of very long chain fatty acids protein [Trypanosoma conorhini]RNF26734.1 elongation of very long chain fatty acids protein [Trypanosoma conorhini]
MKVYLDATECRSDGSLCFYPMLNPFVSWPLLIGAHTGYIVVVFILQKWMQHRAALKVDKPMVVYNLLQIFLSAAMATYLAPSLKKGLFNLNGRFSPDIELWIFVHYCTKFLDMLDTVFMICRKKDDQLSFLHIYHHATIGFIWGLLLRHGMGNGTAFFGAWINSAVHLLMYSHYLWTSFGFRNPLKSALTKVQMFQFLLCILQALLVPFFDHQFTIQWSLLQLLYHISLFFLFLDFYMKSGKKAARMNSKKT